MSLPPSQGDEKRLLSSNCSLWKCRPLLCPLQYRGVKSKGAPGLAFETWDPSNQFPPGNISTGGFMGLRPAQADKKRLGPATTLYGTVVLSFLSSEVVTFLISRKRGCLSPSPPPQQSPCPLATILSFQQPSPCCHPERTRISYFTALTSATYVVLPKENHMHLTEATTLDRKSGEAEGSAVPRTFPGYVFDRAHWAGEI
jgi:hypothetical protein